MSIVRNLKDDPNNWQVGGVSLPSMINIEKRKGKKVYCIKKALVELNGDMFKLYKSQREEWAKNDYFVSIGPI